MCLFWASGFPYIHRHELVSVALPLWWFGRCCGPETALCLMLLKGREGRVSVKLPISLCLLMLLEIQYTSEYINPPWASSKSLDKRWLNHLGVNFKIVFLFYLKSTNYFLLRMKIPIWVKIGLYTILIGAFKFTARAGVGKLRQMLTLPSHFKSVKAAEGRWGNKATIFLHLCTGTFISLSSHMSQDIWSGEPSWQHISCYVWCIGQHSLSYASITNTSQLSAPYINKGLFLTHSIWSVAAKFYAIFLLVPG